MKAHNHKISKNNLNVFFLSIIIVLTLIGCIPNEINTKKKCSESQIKQNGKCVEFKSSCDDENVETVACSITNGSGIQSRTCFSNAWGAYGTCIAYSCKRGYELKNNQCQQIALVCTNGQTQSQSCSITNGLGSQVRTCSNNAWGAYSTCVTSSCNSGYELKNGQCQIVASCSATSTNSKSVYGIYNAYKKTASDQFITNMISASRFSDDSDYYSWIDSKMKILKAKSTRTSLLFVWPMIQSQINGSYNFNTGLYPADEVVGEIYKDGNDIELLAVISPGMRDQFHNPLVHKDEWKTFVKTVASRYPKINYYQLSNEAQDWLDLEDNSLKTVNSYAAVAKATIDALIEVNPQAKLVVVAEFSANTAENSDVADMIAECKKINVPLHAIDIHHWSTKGASSWQMPNLKSFRDFLDTLGYNDTEIWSAEHAAYVGKPSPPANIQLPPNVPASENLSEEDQARWMIKSFTYNRFNGLDRVMWNDVLDYYNFDGSMTSMFNGMGLISDGYVPGTSGIDSSRLGTERISFYTYKMMTEKTDNDQAELVGTVSSVHNDSTLFAYEFKRRSDCSKFYIAWSEGGTQSVSLPISFSSAHITNMISDRYGIAKEEYDKTSSGSVQLSIGSDPLLIESNSSSATKKCSISSAIIAQKDACAASNKIASPNFNANGCHQSFTCVDIIEIEESGDDQNGGQLPPQGGTLPPQGGTLPPQGGTLPPQGGTLPPQSGMIPPKCSITLDLNGDGIVDAVETRVCNGG